MLFSSLPFLFYFLPVVILLYFIVPWRLKNASIVLASLIFYAWGEPKYVLLMLATIAAGYGFGLWIEQRQKKGRSSRAVFVLSVICVLASLFCFKYLDFLIDTVNSVAGSSISPLKIALPIGISFYSFQLISYLADVQRKDEEAQHNFIDLAAYISFFPQLIAGPIVRYGDIALQLKKREHTSEKIAKGARRFVMGMSKKILIANILAQVCNAYYSTSDPSVLYSWLYAVSFSLQIYFDFSGYSDMAIGLGSIFGFDFPENFNYPFISKSITEFWRRWHMTLGTWFRDYVYIPLGGNRVSTWKHLRNILVVWALTGLWHGASWNFVAWGLYYALWLLIEKYLLKDLLKKTKILPHIYMPLLTLIGFIIFDASSMGWAFTTIADLFGLAGHSAVSVEALYNLRSYLGILIIGLVGATPLPKMVVRKLDATSWGSKILLVLEPLVLIGLVVVCSAYLVDGSFNPFLYFRF